MRRTLLMLVGCLLLASQRTPVDPFVPIGIWYAGPGALPSRTAAGDPDVVRRDLAAIRRAGFNAITTWIEWRAAERLRGNYDLADAERLIAAAAQADLDVYVRLLADAPPAWARAVASDRQRFVDYASVRLRRGPRVVSVELTEGDAVPSDVIRVGKGARTPVEGRLEFWAALARGVRAVMFIDTAGGFGPAVQSLGETAGVVTRNQALFAPLRPRAGGVRSVTGASGAPVDVKLLESAEALMILGMNYSAVPQKVTINFASEIPEAIWQNLETGSAVNFVMGPSGPFLAHTFAPRDTLVLMIRKKLR